MAGQSKIIELRGRIEAIRLDSPDDIGITVRIRRNFVALIEQRAAPDIGPRMFPLLSYFVRKTSETLQGIVRLSKSPGLLIKPGRVGVAGGVSADAIADTTSAHLLDPLGSLRRGAGGKGQGEREQGEAEGQF